jgi:hypothetical protein
MGIAASSDLIALVPRASLGNTLIKDRAAAMGVQQFETPVGTPEILISALWHPRVDADPAQRWFASAAMEVPFSFEAKSKWLQKHFPFVPPSRILFCGDREIINADSLVDDTSRHFVRFRGIGVLFTALHNARECARLRAGQLERRSSHFAQRAGAGIKFARSYSQVECCEERAESTHNRRSGPSRTHTTAQ